MLCNLKLMSNLRTVWWLYWVTLQDDSPRWLSQVTLPGDSPIYSIYMWLSQATLPSKSPKWISWLTNPSDSPEWISQAANPYDSQVTFLSNSPGWLFLGPLRVVWQVSFGCWVTWSISSWQEYYKSVFFPKAEWWLAELIFLSLNNWGLNFL